MASVLDPAKLSRYWSGLPSDAGAETRQMAHTIKSGKNEVTISSARLARHADRMFRWSSERRHHAAEAAKKRLHGKHPRKADAATALVMGHG